MSSTSQLHSAGQELVTMGKMLVAAGNMAVTDGTSYVFINVAWESNMTRDKKEHVDLTGHEIMERQL